MPPARVIRAADGRPTEIQDMLPSDGKFKIILFTGELEEGNEAGEVRRKGVKDIESGLVGSNGSGHAVLRKYGPSLEWVDIVSVMVGTKENSNFTSVPEGLRSHWSKYVISFTFESYLLSDKPTPLSESSLTKPKFVSNTLTHTLMVSTGQQTPTNTTASLPIKVHSSSCVQTDTSDSSPRWTNPV